MNPKIEKSKAEYRKNADKIFSLQERNRKLAEQIKKLENLDIIGLVREVGMTPEELAELLAGKSARQAFPGAAEKDKETEGFPHDEIGH